MRRGIASDIEHRRGLVLGLTLAEVLLLLLFLLLLALGSQVVELGEKEKTTRAERDALAATIPKGELETGSISVTTLAVQLTEAREKASALETKLASLEMQRKEQDAKLQEVSALSKHSTRLAEILSAASKFDPNDPPAALERGLEWIESKGLTAPPRDPPPASAEKAGHRGKHDWPPIISLSEAGGHFFASGSADLSPEFRGKLSGEVADRLVQIIKEYDVNVIEVIGHTDEQPLIVRASNLDKTLGPFLQGKPAERFIPSDNAGLGIARAVSVVRVLSADGRLDKLAILPLSGGQMIDVGDKLSVSGVPAPAQARRRIEIRVRRSNEPSLGADTSGWKVVESPASESVITGSASIVDADTIEISGKRIRIWGVDAIENGQLCTTNDQIWDCAKDAASALNAHLTGQTVVCSPVSHDPVGRVVAKCTVGAGDLGEWLVGAGLALDYPEYSKGAYASDELKAKAQTLGVWRSTFIPPWEWRQSH
jgi:endonuclease YncB( thermonuclease family)/flagellar motor protein MotB